MLIGPSVSLAVDAFQIPPFTMRVHLVTQDERYFGFEWPHAADDYSADALLTEQLASWLRRLAV